MTISSPLLPPLFAHLLWVETKWSPLIEMSLSAKPLQQSQPPSSPLKIKRTNKRKLRIKDKKDYSEKQTKVLLVSRQLYKIVQYFNLTIWIWTFIFYVYVENSNSSTDRFKVNPAFC